MRLAPNGIGSGGAYDVAFLMSCIDGWQIAHASAYAHHPYGLQTCALTVEFTALCTDIGRFQTALAHSVARMIKLV
jgi:hypothetical protein